MSALPFSHVPARARITRVVISTAAALVLGLGLGAPAIAPAHQQTAPGHAEDDDSIIFRDPTAEARFTKHTVQTSAAPAATAAATVSSDPGQSGQWGPLVSWPVVGIHTALLPNGKVLSHDAVGDQSYTDYPDHTYTRATVWDPATNSFTPNWVTGFDIFCNGLAHLPNGAVFTAGGNADQSSNGIIQTHLFDYLTNLWTRGTDMAYARWYPTVTALTNGEMLITSGRPTTPEVRQTDGSMRSLPNAALDLPLYPWIDVAPNGRAFHSGPDDALRMLDPTGNGAWQRFGARGDGINRDYGGHAMYDVGKILVAGGGPSTPTARTIDINRATPEVSTTGSMGFGRRQLNLTALADGTVLATGGNSNGASQVDVNAGVYNAEVWNPATGNWTTLAAEQVTRQYHSTALLLPDGRVLSAGGGVCGACDAQNYLGKNAQIFSPPYLFKKDGSGQLATRPQISGAPSALTYGASFQITTPSAAAIRKVGLVKLGAVTHADNMDQRYVPLIFSAGSGQLSANVPSNAHLAPPGHYMLFIVDSSGVPSVAKVVWVGNTTPPPAPPAPNQPPSVSLSQPTEGATFTAPATVEITATAADADGTVAKVEFFMTRPNILGSTVKLGEDTTAPYNFQWTGAAAGTYALSARVTDDRGVTATTPVRTGIKVAASTTTNRPPTVSITSPAAGTSFAFKSTITITASASDPDVGGSVTKVEFLDGTVVLGTGVPSGSGAWSYTWKNVGQGNHTLYARATDNAGAVTTSAGVGITVNKRGN